MHHRKECQPLDFISQILPLSSNGYCFWIVCGWSWIQSLVWRHIMTTNQQLTNCVIRSHLSTKRQYMHQRDPLTNSLICWRIWVIFTVLEFCNLNEFPLEPFLSPIHTHAFHLCKSISIFPFFSVSSSGSNFFFAARGSHSLCRRCTSLCLKSLIQLGSEMWNIRKSHSSWFGHGTTGWGRLPHPMVNVTEWPTFKCNKTPAVVLDVMGPAFQLAVPVSEGSSPQMQDFTSARIATPCVRGWESRVDQRLIGNKIMAKDYVLNFMKN